MCVATKLASLGDWTLFVFGKRWRPDIVNLVITVPHKAARLPGHLRRRGARVPLHTGPWDPDRLRLAAR